MRHLLLLSAIVAIALSQYCPMCAAGACTFAAPGMASCSACEAGALLNVTSNADSVENGVLDHKTIGMCQACPIGCYSCHFALVSPSMSTPIYANQCDNCADGYVYNYANGGCELLPSNCLSGSCVGNNCYAVSCTECRAGYTVVRNDDTGPATRPAPWPLRTRRRPAAAVWALPSGSWSPPSLWPSWLGCTCAKDARMWHPSFSTRLLRSASASDMIPPPQHPTPY